MKSFIAALYFCAAFGAAEGRAIAQAPETPNVSLLSIESVHGDLYRVKAGDEVSIFLVTGDGIILADPLTPPGATQLKNELMTRFPNQPVRYVVHTSRRFERAEGASRFKDTAEIIGHRGFNEAVDSSRDSLPASLAPLDTNRNRRLEAVEVAGDPRAAFINLHDSDRDGIVTSFELSAYVERVKTDYRSRRSLVLGGKRVELVYPGPAYGPDSTAVHFPAERVVFVDNAPDVTGAFSFGSTVPADLLTWLRTIAQLDFDVMISGRGNITPRASLMALEAYLQDLIPGVAAGYDIGRSVADLENASFLDAYKGSIYYSQRRAHVADVYRSTRIARVALHGVASLTSGKRDTGYCASYIECTPPKLRPARTLGISASLNHFVALAEMTAHEQSIVSRSNATYDDAFASRQTQASFLFGYGTPAGRRIAFNLLGGPACVWTDAQGVLRYKDAFPSLGGRRPIRASAFSWALAAGGDVIMSLGRLGVVVPVRVTHAFSEPYYGSVGSTTAQVGMGLRFAVYRHAR
jgi:hypothetical protein